MHSLRLALYAFLALPMIAGAMVIGAMCLLGRHHRQHRRARGHLVMRRGR